MVVQDQAMGLSLSNDTFRQLKDRRRHRRQAGKVNIRLQYSHSRNIDKD